MKKIWFSAVLIFWIVSEASAQISGYQFPRAITMDAFHYDSLAKTHPLLKLTFEYLKSAHLAEMTPGRYPIQGDDVYMIIVQDTARSKTSSFLEAHHVYTDIQIVLQGDLLFGISPSKDCVRIKKPYSAVEDIIFFWDEPQLFTKVKPGQMILFSPRDAHATDIGKGKMKKAVVKIRL